jgi:hypothetical protein
MQTKADIVYRPATDLLASENRMFMLARLAKRPTNWIAALVLGVLFLLLGALPVGIVIGVLLFSRGVGTDELAADGGIAALQSSLDLTVAGLLLGFLPSALLTFAWITWFERRPVSSLGFVGGSAARKFGIGLLVGFASIAAVILLLLLSGSAQVALNPNMGVSTLLSIALLLLAFIVQGSTEEIIARGFVMQSVGLRLGPLWALIISSLWFGLLHALNDNFSWLALLNITLAGVFMACYALYEGGLWGVCAWHAAWNWAQGSLFGVEVSGIQLPVSVLETTLAGNPIWTGGSFGAEGGLACTLFLSLGIAAFFALARRR